MNERRPFAIPTVADTSLGRASLSAWLDANARVPLRYIVGQPGSGKTTAVAAWARQTQQNVAWVTLRDGHTDGQLFATLTELLVQADDREAQLTIVFDDVDRASPDARELLSHLYLYAVPTVSFIYIARGFGAINVSEGEQRGIACVAGAALLRMSAEEIALLCEALGVGSTPSDCAAIAATTDGWALAVTGIVRAAHVARRPLLAALPLWTTANSATVERVVAEAAKSAPARDAQELFDVLDARTTPGTTTLRRLERVGLFVERIEGRYAVNPVVGAAIVAPAHATNDASPLVLEMFGRFRVVFDGADVSFVRRRDAQIVQYLALQPDGRATRAKLIRTFWPDTDPQLGAQGLRTACSAIRRAIAARVGADAVDRYLFSAPAQIGLRFDAVASSAHRFGLHAELAAAAEKRGAPQTAFAHWSAALALYTAPILSGEPVAWWIERQSEMFASLALRARQFLRDADPVRVR